MVRKGPTSPRPAPGPAPVSFCSCPAHRAPPAIPCARTPRRSRPAPSAGAGRAPALHENSAATADREQSRPAPARHRAREVTDRAGGTHL